MTKTETVRESQSAREWTVRLDCGHRLTVPWGLAPPFVAACIVHHQETCPTELGERPEPFSWIGRDTPGGAFR
jgi:hypothetical protein